jgi:hypothetical protein
LIDGRLGHSHRAKLRPSCHLETQCRPGTGTLHAMNGWWCLARWREIRFTLTAERNNSTGTGRMDLATKAERPGNDPVPMTVKNGLISLGIVVIAVAAFIGISNALGIGVVFSGFLFVLYFAGFCEAAPDKYLPGAIGAFAGLGIAYLLATLPVAYGTAGMAIVIALLLAAIYALIMGWAPLVVNNGMMLFLSVGAIPALQQPAMIAEMAKSTLLSVSLIGAGLAFGRWRASRR